MLRAAPVSPGGCRVKVTGYMAPQEPQVEKAVLLEDLQSLLFAFAPCGILPGRWTYPGPRVGEG